MTRRNEKARETGVLADIVRTTLTLPRELWVKLGRVARSGDTSVMEATRVAIRDYVESSAPSGEGLDHAWSVLRDVRTIGPNSNPYMDLMAGWRVGRTARQIHGLVSGQFELDMWPAEVYLVNVLRELTKNLSKADELLIVTNLAYWKQFTRSGKIMEMEAGRYLDAQRAAIANGMRLHRVFLLNEKDDNSLLAQHLEFAREFKDSKTVRVDGVWAKSSEEFDELMTHIGHFACIRRRKDHGKEMPSREPDQGSLIVEPVAPMGVISRLRFVFSRGPSHQDTDAQYYVDRFFRAFAAAKPLL